MAVPQYVKPLSAEEKANAAQYAANAKSRVTGGIGQLAAGYALDKLLTSMVGSIGTQNYGDVFDTKNRNGTDGFIPSNTDYVITLIKNSNTGTSLRVNGVMPHEFQFTHTNEGSPVRNIAAETLGIAGEGALSKANQISSALTGTSLNRMGDFFLWTGGNPLEFPLTLRFDAYKDPMREVIDPVQTLFQMAAPKITGLAMESPWPTLKDVAASATSDKFLLTLNNAITLRAGKHTTVAGLVIQSLALKYASRAERKTGLPIYAEVDITFRSVLSYSKAEYLTMFGGTGFGTRNTVRADR